jgi:pentatricopeptide repeat protein
LLSVFPAHAPTDAPFARELSAFLESGCEAVSFIADAAIKPGEDMIDAAETGLSADVLVIILSSASNPARWLRERWEPILFGRALETNTRVAIFLSEECAFPPLFRRLLKFFDATAGRLEAMRRLKRWLWGIQSGIDPDMVLSPDLETLYCVLADRPGRFTASGAIAERFALEAAQDFEAVLWIPSHGRTLSQIAGELGSRLGMTLDGPIEDNCRRICEVLSGKRCLVILDAPHVAVDPLLPAGRTSILFTSEPVRTVDHAPGLSVARGLFSAGRFAEAYEMFYELLSSGVEKESCARDLIWICEHWERLDEANALRFHIGPSPSEQLLLF